MNLPEAIVTATVTAFADMGAPTESLASLKESMVSADADFGFTLTPVWAGAINGMRVGCEIRKMPMGAKGKTQWIAYLTEWTGSRVTDRTQVASTLV